MEKPALSLVAIAVTSVLLPAPAKAQEQTAADKAIETIQITATRRSGTVQEAPLNITALNDDVIAEQNIKDISDVARWVPGLSAPDQGARDDAALIVRGLNTNSSGPNSDGGTVATYVGEIPLYINMRLTDIERVEVLIGPQGTLYGAGTLGGAIRYMPKAPDLDFTTLKVFGDISQMAESDSVGAEGGLIFNTPLIEDKLALRASLNYVNDPGYIDYNYVVRQPGTSLPDPDWSNASEVESNLKRVADANGEKTLTTRVALRWTPTDWLDTTLSYLRQNQKAEGRSIVHATSLADSNPLSDIIGDYESAYRVEEPYERTDSLLSLEITADLGFAELVSATGMSKWEEDGQRDQTDLLIRLAFSYEEFPAFTAFTRELGEEKIFTQEIRLVSQGDSDWSWIVGGYYNKDESDGSSSEFTPGFDEYAIDVWGAEGFLRPDSLEYYSVDDTEVTEQALFGELSWKATDKLEFTVGTRFYKYEVDNSSALDLPLYETVFGGRDPDSIVLDFENSFAEDDGNLLKFNTNYKFTRDILGYLTISEGFRIGGSNSVAACPQVLEPGKQYVCAEPDEMTYEADTTTNYELGFKSSWLKNRFHFNAALFNVDWDNAQVAGATVNGQQPITSNAGSANSKGVEISSRALLTDDFSVYATFAHTKAKLTEDAPYLFGVVDDQGTPLQDFYDGKDGDRLPGSPENQFSFGATYTTEVLGDLLLDLTYGLTYQSDVFTKVGNRADGETLPGYSLSNIAAKLSDESWSVTFYIDNLFDKYAYSAVRRDKADIGLAKFPVMNSNGTDIQRNYGHYLIRPRTIGLNFSYDFTL
ncbi:TonB-dependent receptor [Aliiglaciecola sp. CAU 1673]|uniref:TonB-dependent receptor n=1 Tax=Aliiglaciecola sp. CAU 1673 TaxID=3032595 RepID=UPI0023DB9FD9|nr:TonB-dependent receptor [Aliiglaciecola sp. CAU 1673]MDF2178713.1 TonB-dependent receptor [Aliiglaciecola sp. CAU 1673]